nr:MAG TPA: hypothetical protein [Caudoviricetes sp.]
MSILYLFFSRYTDENANFQIHYIRFTKIIRTY